MVLYNFRILYNCNFEIAETHVLRVQQYASLKLYKLIYNNLYRIVLQQQQQQHNVIFQQTWLIYNRKQNLK